MTEFMTPPAGFPRRESITPEAPETATPATTAAIKKTYLQRILETQVDYPEHIIEVMKEFKRHHKLGTEPDQSRLDAMSILAREIANAYSKSVPIVRMDDINGGSSAHSCYSPDDHSITMRGKLSIVTFLHEMAHAVFDYNEHMCRVWSLNLFNKIYPKSFAKLRGDGKFMTMESVDVRRPVRTQSMTRSDINRLLERAIRAVDGEGDAGHNPYDRPAVSIFDEGGADEPAS